LTAEYNVSPNTKESYYRMFMQAVGQLDNSSDIAFGFLPLYEHTTQVAEATISYIYTKFS